MMPIEYLPLLVGLWLCWLFGSCLYNLYLHPLRKIPGPKLAAMSSLYEFFYDVLQDGKYMLKIKDLHEQYGNIIRVNPNEIHISDPYYYHQIYTGTNLRVEKYASTLAGFGVPLSMAATIDDHHHRIRRTYLNQYFSKQAVYRLQSDIHERIDALFDRFRANIKSGQSLSLDKAFGTLTADIILRRFVGYHSNFIDNPEFESPIRDGFLGISGLYHAIRFFPAIIGWVKTLPISVVKSILPGVADFLTLAKDIETMIGNVQTGTQESKSVILHALMNANLPEEERTVSRLLDEGLALAVAGTETVARTLAVAMFYLLNDKDMLEILRAEIAARMSGSPPSTWTLQNLAALPYLTGCVKEALRLSFGPCGRLPRIFPDDDLVYEGIVIPAGYPVSQSSYTMHLDPTVFPEPKKFDPMRWSSKESIPLDRFLASFTKGKRQCLGINMAYAELYIILARIVDTFDMNLSATDIRDVQADYIRVVAHARSGPGDAGAAGEVEVVVLRELSMA